VTPHDRFHPPTSTDPWWTETCWFSFGDPEQGLAGAFYPLFRKNLGVAALTVAVWDDRGAAPWQVPYHRAHWHLPFPSGDLDDLCLGGLRYQTLDPLSRYRVRYRDGEAIDVDLVYEALMAPHEVGMGGGHGHLDQPCRFAGEIMLHGVRHEVSGLDMRDRSWGPRADDRPTRGSYSYGIAGPGDAFLAFAFRVGAEDRVAAGFLLRDGERAPLVGGRRETQRGPDGWPTRVVLDAEDGLGRQLRAAGAPRSRLAFQASPGLFAWMSFTRWDFAGGCHGQDQDIWSPDQLARASGRYGPEAV
jgi:hypothetical protein